MYDTMVLPKPDSPVSINTALSSFQSKNASALPAWKQYTFQSPITLSVCCVVSGVCVWQPVISPASSAKNAATVRLSLRFINTPPIIIYCM